MDSAFSAALTNPQCVAPHSLADTDSVTQCTLRTDVYNGPHGSGFAVVATLILGDQSVTIVRQHGPETHREKPAPTLAALLEKTLSLREKAYPPITDLADAMAKLQSLDPAIAGAGQAQLTAYSAACLSVKARYPKLS